MDKNLILKAQELRNLGYSFGKIAYEMHISKSKATYLCKLNADDTSSKESTNKLFEDRVQNLVKECNSINEICQILAKDRSTIKRVIEKYKLDISHFGKTEKKYLRKEKKSLDEWLQKGVKATISQLRKRLIREGVKEYKCERCGRTEWEGEPIPLQLHHINGDKTDNRLENLQMLCPNCHALTENYSGKKNKKEKNKCQKCGKEISKYAKYCVKCAHSFTKKNDVSVIEHKNEKITKEKLIEKFKEFGSFKMVGRYFGITDTATKKWFKKCGLPIYSLEMREYIRQLFGKEIKWKFSSGNEKALRDYQNKVFKKKALLREDGSIEKIYSTNKELENDGFDADGVNRVCNGILKTHRKRKFSFLSYENNKGKIYQIN